MENAIVQRLKIMNAKGLYLLAIVSAFIYSITLWYTYLLIFNETPKVGGFEGGTEGFEGFKTFFSAMLIAPLFETFIFQYLIIMGVLKIKFFRRRLYLPILISAFCFSLAHYYSLYYVFYAFGVGCVFAAFFVLFMKRKGLPFLNTLLLHSILNFLVFLSKIYYA